MTSPIWVREAVVIAIHHRQLAEHGGSDGIRDKGLLESALFRPQNQYNYGNPTIFELSVAYGYGLTNNHPFIDGNKRTAYVVMRTFLELNGYSIQASPKKKYEVWIRLANGQLDESDLATWIEEKAVKN